MEQQEPIAILKAEIKQLLLDKEKSATLLSLPENVMVVRKLCHRDMSDAYDVEEVIARDPAFCAYLLQLANSSLYSAGKAQCGKVIDAVRRLGIHAVGEVALVYALRQLHQVRGISQVISEQLKSSWLRGWSFGRSATEMYWQHRHRDPKALRGFDVSDIVTASILASCGDLVVLTAAAEAEKKGYAFTDIALQQGISVFAASVLPRLFTQWNLPKDYADLLLKPQLGDQPIHFTDYLWAVEILECLEQMDSPEEMDSDHLKLYVRLRHMGVLDQQDPAHTVSLHSV